MQLNIKIIPFFLITKMIILNKIGKHIHKLINAYCMQITFVYCNKVFEKLKKKKRYSKK